MPTYAIGDVQGCFTELIALVAKIKFNPVQDRLWFVGDLVNRGPQSLEVLRYVKGLGKSAVTVLGNHDLHLLALALSRSEPRKAQDTLDDVLNASDRDELLDWLRQQPLLHHDAALGYTMIHAGLPPQWNLATAKACAQELAAALRNDNDARELFTHMYGDKPHRWSNELRGIDRLRFITNCFTRLRVCDAAGQLNLKYKGELKAIPEGFFPWFRAPQRQSQELRIVCGHWSALGLHQANGVIAIDTGCVWGGQLCAFRLDKSAPPVFIDSKQSRVHEG
ncbi:MAG: symmetrical bis(5'-nucleosyl)-tetraphosphatase [Candidatus Obscuribacterales bacterium]|nr:symmetrical bis(5'-nucleosyl)-tetraphosphatase [Steroidobacteraceae bacterium]